MKSFCFSIRNAVLLLLLPACCLSCTAQQKDPWTKAQLIEPAVLAAQLNLPVAQKPVVLDIGPAGTIKGALEVGPAEENKNLDKMKALLKGVPKDKEVVIYCGCCPFAKCPNVRPAFNTLLKLGYTHPRLLNLSQNLKADWIDKGYPLQD